LEVDLEETENIALPEINNYGDYSFEFEVGGELDYCSITN